MTGKWKKAGRWIFIHLILLVMMTSHPVHGFTDTPNLQSGQTVQLAGGETSPQPVQEPRPSELYARSAVLMDADTGRILFEKNAHEAMPMASTTKIMTCVLALENGNLKEHVSVSSNASAQPEVHLGMREGERYVLEDLLYSLMLESHNDSAAAIAEHISGSVPAFAELMNHKAKEIGCKDTYFITPNGLDAQNENDVHHTTAEDLARIMRYCINESPKKEEFLRITQTDQHSFSDTEGSRHFICSNHNTFLKMMEGALTGKTGFTGNAGYCYVGALRRDGRTYIAALLACGWPNNRSYKWHDMKLLMSYGLSQYQLASVHTENLEINIEVTDGMPTVGKNPGNGRSPVCVKAKEQSGSVQVLMCSEEEILQKTDIPDVLNAPVRRGDVIGSVSYFLDGIEILTAPVILQETSEKRTFSRCGNYILEYFLLQKASE